MKQNSGFTIIEIMITVLIVAIVLALGAPSFRELMANNRMTTSTNELVTALNLARSEAIKRNARVKICSSSKPNNGNWSCNTSNDWATGWAVFHDIDDDDTPGGDTEEELIRVSEGFNDSITVTHPADLLVYLASGEISNAGEFTLCDDRNKGRTIQISRTGRVKVEVANGC